jgi:hypothetical protein
MSTNDDNVKAFPKTHPFYCGCPKCFNDRVITSALQEIKERLRYYYFTTRQQEVDFINLMIMVEKLKK